MQAIPDRITRRDALGRLAGLAALASATTGLGGEDDKKERPPARIYLSTLSRRGEGRPELSGILSVDPKDGSWSQVVPGTYQDPRVSPDGRRVLCHRAGTPDEQGLYLADLGGDGPPKRIADGPVVRAFWSPDGEQVVFLERKPDRTAAVWRMNAGGTGRVALPIPATEIVLDWSRDGEWFVSSSSRPLEDGSRPASMKGPVYLMHPDGSGERRLLGSGRMRLHPRFSPDSRKVLYTDGADLQAVLTGPLQIETIGVDDKEPRAILGPRGREQPAQAVWSPDGKELAVAYSEYTGDDDPPRYLDRIINRLAISSADGKKIRRLDFPEGLHLFLGDWR
jgi:Tol biopolymer transport system component